MAVLFYNDLNSYQYERLRRYLAGLGYDIERTRACAPYLGATLVDMDRLLARNSGLRMAAVADDDPRVPPMPGPGVRATRTSDDRCLLLSVIPGDDREAVAQWLRGCAPGVWELLKDCGFRSMREAFRGEVSGTLPRLVVSEEMIDVDAFIKQFPHLAEYVCDEASLF